MSWCREVDGEPVVERAKITELLATVGVERAPLNRPSPETSSPSRDA